MKLLSLAVSTALLVSLIACQNIGSHVPLSKIKGYILAQKIAESTDPRIGRWGVNGRSYATFFAIQEIEDNNFVGSFAAGNADLTGPFGGGLTISNIRGSVTDDAATFKIVHADGNARFMRDGSILFFHSFMTKPKLLLRMKSNGRFFARQKLQLRNMVSGADLRDAPNHLKPLLGYWAGKWDNVVDGELMIESISQNGRFAALYAWGDSPKGSFTSGMTSIIGTVTGGLRPGWFSLVSEPLENGAILKFSVRDGEALGQYILDKRTSTALFVKKSLPQ